MNDIFDRAKQASQAAPLKTTAATGTTRRKNLNVPAEFFDRFEALKASGKTTLDFSAFILEATREKFEAAE